MNTETKVGAFVILCSILLVTAVYFVGNEQWGHHVTPYRTYLRYAGGVAPGTEVLFGGITVGRVTTVRAWNQDPTQIEILLEVKEGTPLNAKSVASLGAVSVMSSPAISVTTGAKGAARLPAGEAIPSQETVSIDDMARKLAGIADSAGTLMTQVQGELQGIGAQTQTLLANLNEATGPDNRKQISQMLQQVNTLVAKQSPKFDQITDQVLLATRDADAAIGKIGPLMAHADTTIATVNSTVANVGSTIDQLQEPIRQDLAQLQSTMEQAKALIAGLQAVVRGNDSNIRDTLENLRIATENLDQLSNQIKQNPWSLVRIRQPQDRKVPK